MKTHYSDKETQRFYSEAILFKLLPHKAMQIQTFKQTPEPKNLLHNTFSTPLQKLLPMPAYHQAQASR